MRNTWTRGVVAVAGLALVAAVVTGCSGDSDDEGGGKRGPDRENEAVPLPGTAEPSASRTPRPGPVKPLDLRLVEREVPGACPPGAPAGTAYPDAKAGSCLYVAAAGSGMTVAQAKSATAEFDKANGAGPMVRVELADHDAAEFAALTAEAATRPAPQNRIAMIQDGRLLSAPSVMQSITGGELQITGGFTMDAARRLARDLGGG